MFVSPSLRFLAFAMGTVFTVAFVSGPIGAKEIPPLNPSFPDRLPAEIDGRPVVPDVGCFWSFAPEGDSYKELVDAVAPYGAFDVLTITLRSNNSLIGNEQALETTKKAVEYAKERYGIKTILDIDLRIARYDFEKERPDLAQERLLFQEADAVGDGENLIMNFTAPNLSDHYTGNLPYYVRCGRVVKAWAYNKTQTDEIDPSSIKDVTELVSWDKKQYYVSGKKGNEVDGASNNNLSVSFTRKDLETLGDFVACAVAFRYSYPDLFAEETLELERHIYESFRDVPAFGVAKDEWGFLPNFDRVDNLNDYWYSENMRAAYSKAYNGDDLVDDLFLAFRSQQNKGEERITVVDRFRRLCSNRAVEYEFQNYALTKKVWGKDAFVGVHCTWYPWPNTLEMRKNGVMWWKAPRDVAQTDEFVPFCVRNSLAKASDSLWVNMFYASQVPPYIWEHWTSAASGGRVHIHQIYPRNDDSPKNDVDPKLLPIIADGGVAKIRQKIRMLNLVSNSQIDSPVAVVFGRFAASNPLLPEYKTVGCDICDRFSTQGYPADLIPIDEINSHTHDGKPRWSVSDGYLQYGKQKYQVVVLNGEGDTEKEDYQALRKLANSVEECKTKIISISPQASNEEKASMAEEVIAFLKERGTIAQTPWVSDDYKFSSDVEKSSRPARKSVSRFLDGLILQIAAEESDFGDPIVLCDETIPLNNGKFSPPVSVAANGVFATRFDENGNLTALVASGLKSFQVGDFGVTLTDETIADDPVDVAIWRDEDGEWRGVFQRCKNELPGALELAVPNWRYLQRR